MSQWNKGGFVVVRLQDVDLNIVPRMADPEFAREWIKMADEDNAALEKRIAELEAENRKLRELVRDLIENGAGTSTLPAMSTWRPA